MTRGYYKAIEGINHRMLRHISNLAGKGPVSSIALHEENGVSIKEARRVLEILKNNKILRRVGTSTYELTSSGTTKLPKLVEQARAPVQEDSA